MSSACDMVLLGPPGAGKGAQARRLVAALDLVAIGTGDLLREAVAEGSSVGRSAEAHMRAGGLVPDALIVELVERRLAELEPDTGALFDGFPRTIAQAEALDACLVRLDRRVSHVVALDVGEDEIVARLSRGRFESDGSQLVARTDDRPEIVRERLRTYREQTAPLLGFYAERGLLLRLDGSGEPAALCDEIVAAIGVAGHAS